MNTLSQLIKEGYLFEQNPESNFWGRLICVNNDKKKDFYKWGMAALLFLQQEFKGNPLVAKFEQTLDKDGGKCRLSTLFTLIGALEAFEQIQPRPIDTPSDRIIYNIIAHFHACAIQLRNRHAGRASIVISDEYDVQDLLHALLKLHFSDVRPEEWTPSYAGNSNRIDFLLKDEKIAVEVKMTRTTLRDKEIGDQLIIDIAKYQSHPDVRTLYCFIYDPDTHIRNPKGLESDLNKLSIENFEVKVFVRPQ